MEMYNENNKLEDTKKPQLYILSLGTEENKKALAISELLRQNNIIVEKDIFERSFKAQMKYADKINAKRLLVIGENELNTNRAKLKNMKTGEETEIELNAETILREISK